MNFTHFIGVDISKKTLDICVMDKNKNCRFFKIGNTRKAIHGFLKEQKEILDESAFCMEHTGIYGYPLVEKLSNGKVFFSVYPAIHIKRSCGLVRGKNDKIDSKRIAEFAFKNREELKPWKPQRQIILKLKALTTSRGQLMKCKNVLCTQIKENRGFMPKETLALIKNSVKSTLISIAKDIKKVDEQISELLKSDVKLNHLTEIITSIKGVGKIIASEVIVNTNEFLTINNPKKYACYSGVAPFEHTSGSSVKGKTRVSSMGNKRSKTLLTLGALAAVRFNSELKEYYERKIEKGKNKMLIINAVRNKLIHRIFTCVNQNRKYELSYSKNLA